MKAMSRKNMDHTSTDARGSKTRKYNTRLLPALIAGGACGLMSGPASALQLGELEVQSALGQPLRASIAFALSPNEQLFSHCILLKRGTSTDGLQMLSKASISVANGSIRLTGSTPLREPMLAMQVTIDCPYTANLSRSYTIMLDLAGTVAEAPTVVKQRATGPVATQRVTVRPGPQPQRTVRTNIDTTPIALSTVHTVKVGETLSDIATRIENRPIGLWPAVEAIFAANPDAFINGDVNRLKAGSRLVIPGFDNVTAPVLSAIEEVAPALTGTSTAAADSAAAYAGLMQVEPATLDEGVTGENTELLGLPPENVAVPLAGTDATAMIEVQPGDISVAGDTSFVSPIESPRPSVTVAAEPPIPAEPVVAAAPPAVAVVTTPTRVSAPARTNADWSWMMWLAGSGIALILGLLLFGRKLRDRFGSTPTDAAEEAPIQDDEETARNEILNEFDFPIDDLQPGEQEYTLDADLGAGTGLEQGGEVDNVQDFGFSSTHVAVTELDMELPEEIAAEPETHPTDIIPPQRVEAASILDEEVMAEDDEYDLSMIVDATKQNLGDDVSTEKDLQAIPFDSIADDELDVECTLNDQFGLQTLEKDYEDELTATQVANQEIEKAAAELVLRMAEVSDDATSELPTADSNDLITADASAEVTSEVTVQMPGAAKAENEEFTDSADTGFHNELTAQLPTAEDDATAEMVVESGHVNTKKSTG